MDAAQHGRHAGQQQGALGLGCVPHAKSSAGAAGFSLQLGVFPSPPLRLPTLPSRLHLCAPTAHPQVKRVYMKANLVVHPDKVKQKGGTLEQVATADMVFDVLKAAWGKFESGR